MFVLVQYCICQRKKNFGYFIFKLNLKLKFSQTQKIIFTQLTIIRCYLQQSIQLIQQQKKKRKSSCILNKMWCHWKLNLCQLGYFWTQSNIKMNCIEYFLIIRVELIIKVKAIVALIVALLCACANYSGSLFNLTKLSVICSECLSISDHQDERWIWESGRERERKKKVDGSQLYRLNNVLKQPNNINIT